AFSDGFQLFPAGANLAGFGVGDLVVGGGGGDDLQEVGEFLDDLVGGRDEEGGVGRVLRVEDEEAAGALADPLDEPGVAGAPVQRLDAVERVLDAAFVVRGLGPLVDHRGGEVEVGGNF